MQSRKSSFRSQLAASNARRVKTPAAEPKALQLPTSTVEEVVGSHVVVTAATNADALVLGGYLLSGVQWSPTIRAILDMDRNAVDVIVKGMTVEVYYQPAAGRQNLKRMVLGLLGKVQ